MSSRFALGDPAFDAVLASLANAEKLGTFEQHAASLERICHTVGSLTARFRTPGLMQKLARAAARAMKLLCINGQLQSQPRSTQLVKCIHNLLKALVRTTDEDIKWLRQRSGEAVVAGMAPALSECLTCTAVAIKQLLQQGQMQPQPAGGSSSQGWSADVLLVFAEMLLGVFAQLIPPRQLFESQFASAGVPAAELSVVLVQAVSAFGSDCGCSAMEAAMGIWKAVADLHDAYMDMDRVNSTPPALEAVLKSSAVMEVLSTFLALNVLYLHSRLRGMLSPTAAAAAAHGSKHNSSSSGGMSHRSASKPAEAHHVRLLLALGLPVHSATVIATKLFSGCQASIVGSLEALRAYTSLAHNHHRASSSSTASTSSSHSDNSNSPGKFPARLLQPVLLTMLELVLLMDGHNIPVISLGVIARLLDLNMQQLMANVPAAAMFVDRFMLQLAPVVLQLCSNTELPSHEVEAAHAHVNVEVNGELIPLEDIVRTLNMLFATGQREEKGEVVTLRFFAYSSGMLLAAGVEDPGLFKQLFEPVMTAQLVPVLQVLEAVVRLAPRLTIYGRTKPDRRLQLRVLQGAAAAASLVSSSMRSPAEAALGNSDPTSAAASAFPARASRHLCSLYVSCFKLAGNLKCKDSYYGELLLMVTGAIDPANFAAFLPNSAAGLDSISSNGSTNSTTHLGDFGSTSSSGLGHSPAGIGNIAAAGAMSASLTVPWAWAIAKGVCLAGSLLHMRYFKAVNEKGQPINLAGPLRSIAGAMALVTQQLPALGVPSKRVQPLVQQQQKLCGLIEHEAAAWAAGKNSPNSAVRSTQVPVAIDEFGFVLATELPCETCCNNPSCVDTPKRSELAVAAASGSRCSKCMVARYCCMTCCKFHWRGPWLGAHDSVCRRLRKAAKDK